MKQMQKSHYGDHEVISMTICSVKYLLQAMCLALSYGILIIFINAKPQKYHSFDANEIVHLCLTLVTIKLVV